MLGGKEENVTIPTVFIAVDIVKEFCYANKRIGRSSDFVANFGSNAADSFFVFKSKDKLFPCQWTESRKTTFAQAGEGGFLRW